MQTFPWSLGSRDHKQPPSVDELSALDDARLEHSHRDKYGTRSDEAKMYLSAVTYGNPGPTRVRSEAKSM